MEKKKKSKFLGVLKYLGKTITYTILTILIVCGLALLFVFVSAKVAKSQDKTPPINLYTIISPSMTPNINVYDVVVTIKIDPSKLKVGDVITYYSEMDSLNGMTITHRIVEIFQNGEEYVFKTKGDYNQSVDAWAVSSYDLVGKVYFKIPQLGKVQYFLGSKGGWLLAILIPALGIIAYDIYKIIKLILIKQKIVAYQKQEDLPNNNELGTSSDAFKDILTSENTSPSEPVIQNTLGHEDAEQVNETPEEIVEIKEEDNIVKSFEDQINALDEWKSKIDDDNKN